MPRDPPSAAQRCAPTALGTARRCGQSGPGSVPTSPARFPMVAGATMGHGGSLSRSPLPRIGHRSEAVSAGRSSYERADGRTGAPGGTATCGPSLAPDESLAERALTWRHAEGCEQQAEQRAAAAGGAGGGGGGLHHPACPRRDREAARRRRRHAGLFPPAAERGGNFSRLAAVCGRGKRRGGCSPCRRAARSDSAPEQVAASLWQPSGAPGLRAAAGRRGRLRRRSWPGPSQQAAGRGKPRVRPPQSAEPRSPEPPEAPPRGSGTVRLLAGARRAPCQSPRPAPVRLLCPWSRCASGGSIANRELKK